MLKSGSSHPIHRIVVTGGPCAGKTTGLAVLVEEFSSRGFHVLVVPEAATMLITGGVAPWRLPRSIAFQQFVLRTQIGHENIFEAAACELARERPVIMLMDRGTMDGKAYVSHDEWQIVMDDFGGDVSRLRDGRYDAVIHLVTAADGAKEHYTLSNNNARTESAEQAIVLDQATRNAWVGHPHLRVIDNADGDFRDKIGRLKKEVSIIVGYPEPYEIERKFLLKMTSCQLEETLSRHGIVWEKVEIRQIYLRQEKALGERRVRRRGQNGHYVYFYTEKTDVSPTIRCEMERQISPREYILLQEDADPHLGILNKMRYCFLVGNFYHEVDFFVSERHDPILEVETDEDTYDPPNFIFDGHVVCEVTADSRYRNFAIAERLY